MKYKFNAPPFTAKQITKDKPVILFSFGIIGVIVFAVLKKQGFRIEAICDNDVKKVGFSYFGNVIKSLDQPADIPLDIPVIIASKYYSSIKEQLSEKGLHNVFDCSSILREFDLDISEIDFKIKSIIPWFPETIEDIFQQVDLYMYDLYNSFDNTLFFIKNVDVVVTEKCSLKCRDCANLMQYYQNPIDADYNSLCDSIDTLVKLSDGVFEFRILGGEPFLYRKLGSLLAFIGAYQKKIVIYTNGTIIPKDDIIQSIKGCNAGVVISDYGKHSKNISQLTKALETDSIPYILNRPNYWQDCAGFVDDEVKNTSEIVERFNNCCVKDALTLLHGKLFRCPFSAHAANLKAIKTSGYDCIDLKGELNKTTLRDFCLSQKPLYSCRYCKGRQFNSGTVKPAIQTETPVHYISVGSE